MLKFLLPFSKTSGNHTMAITVSNKVSAEN